MNQSRTKIFLLTLLVIIHSFFTISCVLFILLNSFSKTTNYSYLDFIVSIVVMSFLIYKRCILIDIYLHIKNLDNLPHYINIIPDIAKDNYIRNKLIRNNHKHKKDYTKHRLDILDNVDPLHRTKCCDTLRIMFNHKIHYIISNIIIINILIFKYDINIALPIVISFILNEFPL